MIGEIGNIQKVKNMLTHLVRGQTDSRKERGKTKAKTARAKEKTVTAKELDVGEMENDDFKAVQHAGRSLETRGTTVIGPEIA